MTILFDDSVMADYHQFFLADPSSGSDLPVNWTAGDLRARLLVGEQSLIATTAWDMDVPVIVELHQQQPKIDLTNADHVVIGGLYTSGEIVIAGLTDYLPDARRIAVPAGPLCAMVVSSGLGTLSKDGLEGDDRYAVHLWPGKAEQVVVLQQWEGD